MLCVIRFLAPYTRLSSKQNADAISKGYQFMQQFTLSLKASLALEAKALERKSGEVLCYLLQLSPSAQLQHSRITLPFAAGKGDLATPSPAAQGEDNNCHHPPQFSLRTYSCGLHGSKPLCRTEHVSTARVRAAGGVICKEKIKIKFRFPVLETPWRSCRRLMLCCRGSVPWPTRASPLVPHKHSWGQQGIIAPLFHRKAPDVSRKQLLVGWKPHLAALLLGRWFGLYNSEHNHLFTPVSLHLPANIWSPGFWCSFFFFFFQLNNFYYVDPRCRLPLCNSEYKPCPWLHNTMKAFRSQLLEHLILFFLSGKNK